MSTQTINNSGIYIVREEWLPHNSGAPMIEFIIANDPVVIFQEENESEAKRKAELYFEQRLNYISVKKLINIQIEKWPCSLSLSYATNKENIDINETVVRLINDQNGVFNKQIFKYK